MAQYKLCVDRKVIVWEREYHLIEADNEEAAVQILKDAMEKDAICGTVDLPSYYNVETLLDTQETMEPTDNNGCSTIEIVDQENTARVIWNNALN